MSDKSKIYLLPVLTALTLILLIQNAYLTGIYSALDDRFDQITREIEINRRIGEEARDEAARDPIVPDSPGFTSPPASTVTRTERVTVQQAAPRSIQGTTTNPQGALQPVPTPGQPSSPPPAANDPNPAALCVLGIVGVLGSC